MINVTLIGAGRIGIMHAKNLLDNVNCNLNYVYEISNGMLGRKMGKFKKKTKEISFY